MALVGHKRSEWIARPKQILPNWPSEQDRLTAEVQPEEEVKLACERDREHKRGVHTA